MYLSSPYIFVKNQRKKERKITEQIYRIGIDQGYGNIKTAHHILNSV